MKTDKQLLKIWNEKELSYKNIKRYDDLDLKEKTRIFDLIIKGK